MATDAYTLQSGGWSGYGGASFMVGYDFTPATDIVVTNLGILDWYADGLLTNEQVGIWNGAGVLLASITLPTSKTGVVSAGISNAEFYYAPISPLILQAGVTYRIGNQMQGGATEIVGWGGPYLPAPEIKFGLGRGNNGFTFSEPAGFSNPTPYMGPSFEYSLVTATNDLTLNAPTVRQIIQRNGQNCADVRVEGNWQGNAVRLEARARVMPGSTNNGSSTAWTAIVINPTNGVFEGVLPAVSAGGWYQIEVRAVDASNNVLVTVTVAKVGVGDIFVTAGQSNAASFGSPPQIPGDDRVSAYAVAGNTWQWATDPQINPSGSPGTGGSPWPILGTLLVQSNMVPVGFVAVAWGGTTISQWQPGSQEYLNLTNALLALGANGVRAVLWHQGESDSLASTPAATYALQLSNLVAQSRVDAGWAVPWGIAEASAHPSATLAQQAPVAAGQLMVQDGFSQSGCFRGPRTDDFNMENEVAADGVHFNAAGLADHAQQWANAILGVENLNPINGNFEANSHLPDGVTDYVQRDIGWDEVNAAETGLADGYNGYYNPGPAQYLQSADTNNNGVLSNMNGSQVGVLYSGSTSNSFFQTLRAHLQPSTIYTLQAAFGVRGNNDTFGGYRLDLVANGLTLGSAAGDVASLNFLAPGSATNHFTVVSCIVTSTIPVMTNQVLAIRITKTGGVGTYLDVDNVQLTSQLTAYGCWQMDNWGSLTNPNSWPLAVPLNDGIPNLVKFAFGIDPLTGAAPAPPPLRVLLGSTGVQPELLVIRRQAALGLSYVLETSTDLKTWTAQPNATETVIELGGGFEEVIYGPPPNATWLAHTTFWRVAVTMP